MLSTSMGVVTIIFSLSIKKYFMVVKIIVLKCISGLDKHFIIKLEFFYLCGVTSRVHEKNNSGLKMILKNNNNIVTIFIFMFKT